MKRFSSDSSVESVKIGQSSHKWIFFSYLGLWWWGLCLLTIIRKNLWVPTWCHFRGCKQHTPLQWRHNERDGVSNHQPHDCLLNRLFRRRSNQRKHQSSSSLAFVRGIHRWPSPVTGEFPAQKASNAEKVSIWWHHHAPFCGVVVFEMRWRFRIDDTETLCNSSNKSYRYATRDTPCIYVPWWRHQMETFSA